MQEDDKNLVSCVAQMSPAVQDAILLNQFGLTKKVFAELTSGDWCNMFLSPALTAYIKAKGLLDNESTEI